MAGHIINIQKSVVFLLYTSNEFSEKEIQTVQFIIASKRTQYVGINLTKGAKGLVPCSRLEAAEMAWFPAQITAHEMILSPFAFL